ncbi:glycosyltransferase family 87 protein [Novosphingobium pentaromativorans]|uniref:DUF2029 domain-containing protein n=1 Tax=Novosphingobium pentaromativorans US6-1 TaxID=1088721 RepID=G6EJ50_9SPHN|nr:glycosyltransferase family 87 protein [Novosphingobium pentaromativorans]AIT79009.1 hypothetical protein JI59_03815 [Novosphingobium pentaromativorans US6-1]EHJ58636.1 hypothetical protein NSU_4371 [Novosphingobium pentaromativorans US6-1]
MGADFLRKMDWLGRDRAVAYLRIIAFLNVASLVLLVATSQDGVDANGFLLGSDFVSFWTVGHMLQDHGNVYDGAAHIAAQRKFFASSGGYTAFFYPPTFLPFCWPLGFLSYFPALVSWLLATSGIYVIAVRRWQAALRFDFPLWLLVLAFPAVPIVITHGQTSFMVAALLGLGALLVPGRPVIAGILFGLATIKPQFGILVPLVLLLTREWKVIASAAVTAFALALLSALAFGADTFAGWYAASGRAQVAMVEGAVGFGKMTSVFAGARLIGLTPGLAYGAQAAVGLATIILLIRAFRARPYSPALGALMLAAAPLVTPFVLDYDMVLLAFPLLWLTSRGIADGFRDWEKLALALAFIAPVFARPIGLHLGIPIMPLILGFLFWVLLRRYSAEAHPRAPIALQP